MVIGFVTLLWSSLTGTRLSSLMYILLCLHLRRCHRPLKFLAANHSWADYKLFSYPIFFGSITSSIDSRHDQECSSTWWRYLTRFRCDLLLGEEQMAIGASWIRFTSICHDNQLQWYRSEWDTLPLSGRDNNASLSIICFDLPQCLARS